MAAEAELALREAFQTGDVDRALTETVETYGPEVLGYLVSRLRDHDAANDAFSATCESLCNSISSFGWRCSMRTWMYKLARSAVSHHGRRPENRAEHNIRISQVSQVAARLRTQTRDYLRTDVKDRFAELRQELEPDDQTLLILRVDRGLDWIEVVTVLSDAELEPEEEKRAAAKLRQRFGAVKKRLKTRAVETGLLIEKPTSQSG